MCKYFNECKLYLNFLSDPNEGSLVHVWGRKHRVELSLCLLQAVYQSFQFPFKQHTLQTCFMLQLVNILSERLVQLVSFQLKLCDMYTEAHVHIHKDAKTFTLIPTSAQSICLTWIKAIIWASFYLAEFLFHHLMIPFQIIQLLFFDLLIGILSKLHHSHILPLWPPIKALVATNTSTQVATVNSVFKNSQTSKRT